MRRPAIVRWIPVVPRFGDMRRACHLRSDRDLRGNGVLCPRAHVRLLVHVLERAFMSGLDDVRRYVYLSERNLRRVSDMRRLRDLHRFADLQSYRLLLSVPVRLRRRWLHHRARSGNSDRRSVRR